MSIESNIGRKFRFVSETPREMNGNTRRIEDITKIHTILKVKYPHIILKPNFRMSPSYFYFQCGGDIWFSSEFIRFIDDEREEKLEELLS